MSTALVLKQFHIETTPREKDGDYVEVVGRGAGLISWMLSLMGIEPVTSLRCNAVRIEVKSTSLFGVQTLTLPLSAMTGIVGGHKKPVQFLFAAALVFVLGIIGTLVTLGGEESASIWPMLPTLILCGLLGIGYILNKEMGLYVQNGGDKLHGLSFKPSVIEGVDVNIEQVNHAIKIINWAVLNSRKN